MAPGENEFDTPDYWPRFDPLELILSHMTTFPKTDVPLSFLQVLHPSQPRSLSFPSGLICQFPFKKPKTE